MSEMPVRIRSPAQNPTAQEQHSGRRGEEGGQDRVAAATENLTEFLNGSSRVNRRGECRAPRGLIVHTRCGGPVGFMIWRWHDPSCPRVNQSLGANGVSSISMITRAENRRARGFVLRVVTSRICSVMESPKAPKN